MRRRRGKGEERGKKGEKSGNEMGPHMRNGGEREVVGEEREGREGEVGNKRKGGKEREGRNTSGGEGRGKGVK